MMEKELFIKSIEAIQQQMKYDVSVSEHLEKAFPESFAPNLMPKNHLLQNALLEVLQAAMNDTIIDTTMGQSWIEYFCWELNFGQENWRLKVTEEGKNIPMSNTGELWEYLNNKNKLSNP